MWGKDIRGNGREEDESAVVVVVAALAQDSWCSAVG